MAKSPDPHISLAGPCRLALSLPRVAARAGCCQVGWVEWCAAGADVHDVVDLGGFHCAAWFLVELDLLAEAPPRRGGGAYGKWLNTTSDPTHIIPC
jgi:hypothetical protein